MERCNLQYDLEIFDSRQTLLVWVGDPSQRTERNFETNRFDSFGECRKVRIEQSVASLAKIGESGYS